MQKFGLEYGEIFKSFRDIFQKTIEDYQRSVNFRKREK
jgi:hypothetical protein